MVAYLSHLAKVGELVRSWQLAAAKAAAAKPSLIGVQCLDVTERAHGWLLAVVQAVGSEA